MSEMYNALIVDDERDIRELLVLTLSRMGLRVDTAANLSEAKDLLQRNLYHLCITDMRLPDGNGIDLVGIISKNYPHTPVAMITAFGSMNLAIDALKAGAFDFVSKPVDINVLRGIVKHALELNAPRQAPTTHSNTALNPTAAEQGRLLGISPAMAQLRNTISKAARSQAPIYILGESGVGKELVANTIHEKSSRAKGPFIPVNCGAIPTELMESEFFGHKKGSFTGAYADKQGLFQAAQGGTLFLDEVAELPLAMQVKLLRAIQEKSVRAVGASNEVIVDVRILSATHKDLADLVNEGKFRHDLYYRINVIELRVPPLRERTGDLPLLAETILARLGREQTNTFPKKLTKAALAALETYAFPGNVRELENMLERALALAEGNQIDVLDLHLPNKSAVPEANKPSIAEIPPEAPKPQLPVIDPADIQAAALPSYMEQLERAAIQKALEENRWNKTKTAAQLGITFRALRYKLKKLGLD